MSGVNYMLRGSTLVETLVMMLVASIVFLGIIDGLRLFTRMQRQRTEALTTNGREADGYYRLASLVASADSITLYGDDVELYQGNIRSTLTLRDSALIYRTGEFRDTLILHAGNLRLTLGDNNRPDTVEVALKAGFTAKFPVPESTRKQYDRSIEQLEHGYGYGEK